MESLPFRKLQKKCMELGLSPCAGKGVDKAFLLSLLTSAEAGLPCTRINPKERIRRHDKEFYMAIRKWVKIMPDFRPQEALKRFKDEPQNNWQLIADELDALGVDEESQELMDAINSGEIERVRPFFPQKEKMERILLTYPGLMWLMTKISPEDTVFPLYITHGIYLEEIELKYSHITYIPNKEIATFFRGKDMKRVPYISMDAAILEENIGAIYWSLSAGDHFSYSYNYLYKAIEENKLKALTVLLEERNIDPNCNDGILLWKTINKQLTEAFDIILTHPSIHIDLYYHIRSALLTKRFYFVKKLMDHSNFTPSEQEKQEIRGELQWMPISEEISAYILSHPKMKE